MLALPILAAWVLGLVFVRRYAVPLAVLVAAIEIGWSMSAGGTGLVIATPEQHFASRAFTGACNLGE